MQPYVYNKLYIKLQLKRTSDKIITKSKYLACISIFFIALTGFNIDFW